MQGFPVTIPTTYLGEEDKTRPYGISAERVPRELKRGIAEFVRWSTTDVQLDRSARYSAAVQLTTTDNQQGAILGFMGYLANIRTDVSAGQLTLKAYEHPYLLTGFVSFLRAREVGRGYILKHLSVARKVNNYLVSGGLDWALFLAINALGVAIISHSRRPPTIHRHGHN